MISDSDAFGATLSLAEDNKIIQIFDRSGKLNELDLKEGAFFPRLYLRSPDHGMG